MATKERLAIENLLMIADKEGNDVNFIFNDQQAAIDARLSGRDLIPKARQMGVSSKFLARYLIKCLGKRNTRAVVISHDEKSTQRMLNKVHYYLDHIRGPKARIKNASRNELTFPKTDSMFYIGTAGAKKFGRGDTITDLHCSEVAFWPDPKKLTAGLFQAVPRNGEIAMESTGNGVGNFYHKMCTRAAEGKNRWRLHFLSWLKFREYNLKISNEEEQDILNNLDDEIGEADLIKDYGVTAGQLLFRREKLEELDYDIRLFQQEYPMTLDECFQTTGHSLFNRINYKPSTDWTRLDQYQYVMIDDAKHKRSKYALGVDVGGGVKKDRSVIEIIDLIKWEQVGEWVGDNIAPDVLADKVVEIARYWNDAYVTVESNNYGSTTLLALQQIYPLQLIFRSKQDSDNIVNYGYRTTSKTKPIMIGNLRHELANTFIIHSPLLRSELNTFAEQQNGKLEAEAGCFDDRVMAMATGLMGATRAGYLLEHEEYQAAAGSMLDPFSLEGIIADLKGRNHSGSEYPIPRQDIGAVN
ncbi:hypothetical protein LCGC14_1725550 [marine sediment metagenome]|uniref:Terminase large subunit gp17-like C-terminal domain-containing protein n=1 Tax=marine sediment metagenome TaxID=412755 RepID=A0A0F9JRT1_9ZZZZ